MTHTTRRTWCVPASFALAGAIGWACADDPDLSGTASTSDGTADPPTGLSAVTGDLDPVAVGQVLESIAINVVVPATAGFAGGSTEMHTALQAYASAVDADPVAAGPELSGAQEAWRTAALQWQHLEVMQIGPAAPSVSGIAGENIRDEVYSWPTVDTCSIDRHLVDGSYAADDFFVTELVFAYGLDALEYLLFVHDQNHTCGAAVQLDGPWTGLGFDEIERRRGAYAARIAGEVARQAELLASRWSPDGDNFAAALASPGSESPFENEAVALDDVFRAMFYVDLRTKDDKLGLPLGLQDGCDAAPCPDLFESPYGSLSASAIAANLRALRELVHGGPDAASGNGFDDLLATQGHADVAAALLSAIDAAIVAADAFDVPLQQAIANAPEQVQALYDAVAAVTDVLKGPFVMALMLTLPSEGAGDAD